MIKIIIIAVIIVILGWLGWHTHENSGYVLITYSHWSIETSLWMAVFSLFLLFLALYLLIRLLAGICSLTSKAIHWRARSQKKRAPYWLEFGTCELIEQRWKPAEEALIKSAKKSDKPLTAYINAALAAQKQGAFDRRDTYLKKAYQSTPEAEISLGFLQAQLQIKAEQWDQASSTLQKLEKAVPHHALLKTLKNSF